MHNHKSCALAAITAFLVSSISSVTEVRADSFLLRGGKNLTTITETADQSDPMIPSWTIPTEDPSPASEKYRYMVKYKPHSEVFQMRMANARRRMTVSGRSLMDGDVMFIPKDDIEVMHFESEADAEEWRNEADVEDMAKDTKVYPAGEEIPYGITNVQALNIPDTNIGNRKVCIVDSGYDMSHPDLPKGDDILTGVSNGNAWNSDGTGHGSHVAGTIAAIGGNDIGVVGTVRNGQLKMHIVRVFNDDERWNWGSSLISAVEECVAAEANIVNMSLGSPSGSNFESSIYKRILEEDNILLIASAGNGGNSDYLYPASFGSVISVAAVDKDNNKASFSQYNDQVDISAPGFAVKSTTPGHRYSTWYGTSMSAPHVTGVAALIWSHFPERTALEIRQVLLDTALDLGDPGRDDEFGHGFLQGYAAYRFLVGTAEPSASPSTLSPTRSPTMKPTASPSKPPTMNPTATPSMSPTASPSGLPSFTPTKPPTSSPTPNPTSTPSKAPSSAPTSSPSTGPTNGPTISPTPPPTKMPSSSPTSTPSTSPSAPPTKSPSSSPTHSPTISAEPSGSPSMKCVDSPPNWHDSFGVRFNCTYYQTHNECHLNSNSYRGIGGKTALEACCECGGGIYGLSITAAPTKSPTIAPPTKSPTTASPISSCVDNPPNWHDGISLTYNCKYYESPGECLLYGGMFPGVDGKTALEACCTCGGGNG